MSYNWGPHYIVPSGVIKTYSGNVLLREEYDEALLHKELAEIGLTGRIVKVNNPWYYRKKDTDTWIQIGESQDEHRFFPVRWDTTNLENGQYEVMGLMHVFVEEKNGSRGKAIARENVVEVTVEN
jgi:hypothetical protein